MYNKNKPIIKKLSNVTYSLQLNSEYNLVMYEMLLKIFKLSFFDDNTDCLIFTAEKQITLSKFLKEEDEHIISYEKCIRMIDEIYKQLNYLYKNGFGLYGFDIDDIIVVNDNSFVIINDNYLAPLENNYLLINYLPQIPYFNNPEINKITNLPARISYKSIYYSLGELITYSLLNNNEIIDLDKDIEEIILPLKNTKIYWFLKRCLNKDYTKRNLLLI